MRRVARSVRRGPAGDAVGAQVPDVYQCFTKEMGVFSNPTSPNAPAKLRVAFEVSASRERERRAPDPPRSSQSKGRQQQRQGLHPGRGAKPLWGVGRNP